VENGCQWFIPGSHCGKLYDHVQNWDPAMKKGFYFTIPSLDPSLEAKAVPILLKKGQFSLHHALMLHRSLKNRSPKPRRGLASHFFDATIKEMWDLFKNAPPETTPVLRGSA
jgi:ectoine hydroxylase-related dioxygenase (phytanoyl-CoA dioxygenase family)